MNRKLLFISLIVSLFFSIFIGCDTENIPNSGESQSEVSPYNVINYYYVNSGDFPKPDEIEYSRLTHICHCFVYPDSDGSLIGIEDLVSTIGVIKYAHQHAVKVLLCIGGATADADIIVDPYVRSIIIDSLVSMVLRYGYDGVDVDWEGFSGEDMKLAYTAFSQELRSKLDEHNPELIMSAAVPSSHYWGQWYDWDEVKDYYQIWFTMTYDMSGEWDLLAYHHTAMNLDPDMELWSQSATGAVDYWLGRGVPREELHIGLGFYGYLWEGVNDIGVPTSEVISVNYHNYQEILQIMDQRMGTKKWDAIAECPYYVGDDVDKFLITYDDEESIERKCSSVKDESLAGVGIWHLSGDYDPDSPDEQFPLSKVVEENLLN